MKRHILMNCLEPMFILPLPILKDLVLGRGIILWEFN